MTSAMLDVRLKCAETCNRCNGAGILEVRGLLNYDFAKKQEFAMSQSIRVICDCVTSVRFPKNQSVAGKRYSLRYAELHSMSQDAIINHVLQLEAKRDNIVKKLSAWYDIAIQDGDRTKADIYFDVRKHLLE